MKAYRLACLYVIVTALLWPVGAWSLNDEELKAITFDQHLGRQLSLEAAFRDEEGRQVSLRDYFRHKGNAVVLVPGYFRCEMLCSGVSDGILRALQGVKKTAGSDFKVVFVSIDPAEHLEQAQRRKRTWIKRYGRPKAKAVFLSGGDEVIKAFSDEIGFHYRYDSVSGEFAHPAGFVVATPEGKISRYFFGVSFSARELETALEEAGREREGSMIRSLLLLCFHYNPLRSVYGNTVIAATRLLGLGTVVALALAVIYCQKQRRKGGEP